MVSQKTPSVSMKNFHSIKGTYGGIYVPGIRKEFNQMESSHKKFFAGFFVVWVLCFLASLGVIGVVIWAIIRLVTKYG